MKKKIIIPVIIAIVVAIIGYAIIAKQRASRPEYTVAKVETGDIIQTVSEVGTVKASQKLDLSFLQTGRISKINVKIGDLVKSQDVLAELDKTSLLIQKQETEASLLVSQANLEKVLAGASRGDIAVSEENVQKAYSAYESAISDYNNTIAKAEDDIKQAEKNLADLKSNDASNVTPHEKAVETAEVNLANIKAVNQQSIANSINNLLATDNEKLTVANNAMDQIKLILDNDDLEGHFSVRNSNYKNLTENSYEASAGLLSQADESYLKAVSSKSDYSLSMATADVLNCLNEIYKTLGYCYNALENTVTSISFSQSELDALKLIITGQQTYISSGISAVQNSDQSLTNSRLAYDTNVKQADDALAQARVNLDKAIKDSTNFLDSLRLSNDQLIARADANVSATKKTWELAKAELGRVKSPARAEDVSLVSAQVKQAEAALNLVNQRIVESTIISPINGQVIDVVYKVGEQANAGMTAISISEENGFKIEVDISEADIAKIKIGNKSEITLDAYGDSIKFPGSVTFIEPAETVIQDVIYYKVTLYFDDNDSLISRGVILKPGMTANVLITANEKKNVLLISSRAMIEKNGGTKYARVLVNDQIEERPIEIGLRGDGGVLEVLSGLWAGETVVTNIKINK